MLVVEAKTNLFSSTENQSMSDLRHIFFKICLLLLNLVPGAGPEQIQRCKQRFLTLTIDRRLSINFSMNFSQQLCQNNGI